MIQVNDTVVILDRNFSGDLKVGVVTDELPTGLLRVHWGNLFEYFGQGDLRKATETEAKLAREPHHPSFRLGFH